VVVEELRCYCPDSFIAFRLQTIERTFSPLSRYQLVASRNKKQKEGSPLATEMAKRGDPFTDI
jgi:hypothetical protein